jgi:SAM-dependent methyltransferase
MKRLVLPDYKSVPALAPFLEGTHNYDMDKHTRLIYHPISGMVYKRRFSIAVDMLADCCGADCGRIVEVGYGAGLLFPTLSKMACEVIGVDVLDKRAVCEVDGMLHDQRLQNVRLESGSILALPLADASVDALLCLSVLEHLHPGAEMIIAAREINRVLRPEGVAVLGFPVKNIVTRALFRVLGYNDNVIHPSGHRDILSGLADGGLKIEALRRFPVFLPTDMGLYAVGQLRKGLA